MYLADIGVEINNLIKWSVSIVFFPEVDGNEEFSNKFCCEICISKIATIANSSEFLKICSFCIATSSQNAITEFKF